jgi:hypothetical protein
MQCKRITPRWNDGRTVIVAAPGPSLTEEVAERCKGHTCLAVKEAYRLIPWADVCYGCDAKFWLRNEGCQDFAGERWASHGNEISDNKLDVAQRYGLRLVQGVGGPGFSLNSGAIHYGGSSGFQAINLTILFGATRIVLVGFDMKARDGKRYFFGNHPTSVAAPHYGGNLWRFDWAAKRLPPHITILNATPGSALKCFPRMSLDEALAPAT